MRVKKQSAWQFDTSSTVGLSAGLVAGGAGALYLKDPRGQDVTIHYVGVGAALGFGLDTPGNVGNSIAPASFPNAGTVLILESFADNELSRSDLTGPCSVLEVSGAFFVGGSASVLLLGMSYLRAPIDRLAFFGGFLTQLVIDELWEVSASAMIVLGGATVSVGASISGLNGYAW